MNYYKLETRAEQNLQRKKTKFTCSARITSAKYTVINWSETGLDTENSDRYSHKYSQNP